MNIMHPATALLVAKAIQQDRWALAREIRIRREIKARARS